MFLERREELAEVYLFLAEGFEEIEALSVVDLLRRADIEIKTVSITDKLEVEGSHKIKVLADSIFESDQLEDGVMLVLPGGLKGTNNLMAHKGLKELLFTYQNNQKKLAAICAAPSILGMNGILRGKKATCFPGFEEKLLGAEPVSEKVVVDGNIITSRGAGTAIDFALSIIAELRNGQLAEQLANTIQLVR